MEHQGLSTTMRRILLPINCLILAVGICGGPLMMRLYYVEGGSNAKFYFITPRIFIASFVIGIVTGVDDFLYSWGGSKLPVSTSSLLLAAQLAFTAVGAFFIVKLKFTPYSINAVVLLTVGDVLLGVRSNDDRPEGVTSKAYILGFMMTLVAAVLYGVILPCIELIYLKAKQVITATLVLEIQMVMCFGATAFCTIGIRGVHGSGEKGLAFFLSLWGFVSYFYGKFRQTKKQKNKSPKTKMTTMHTESVGFTIYVMAI
ncbi:purine permease 1-like [Nicotiana tabacum]|uniref:Purine permease 1-like n=1 Tax=Nicotiana tabacum TaxID=4097 RepID=A0AC58TGN9_TOBAC